MTGFYTDDYEDRCFKRPEEIRKAGLRGADLRGAITGSLDGYLVDLRDAILDQRQRLQAQSAALSSAISFEFTTRIGFNGRPTAGISGT